VKQFADPATYAEALMDGAWIVSNPATYPASRHMTITYGNVLLRLTHWYGDGWFIHERLENGRRMWVRYGMCQLEDQELLSQLCFEAPIYNEV
jgi:hypothetical protein